MHRIDTPTAQADKFGPGKNGFTNGDPATGRRATDLNSDMWDAVQEEICAVIEKSGLALDKEQHDQLYQAIVKIITSKIPDALLKKNNLSDLTDIALARASLQLKSAATRDVTTSRYDTTSGHVLQVTDYGLGTTAGLTSLASIFDIACTGKYSAAGVGAGSIAAEGMPANSGNTRFSVEAESIYANQFWVTLRSSNQAYIGQVNTSTKTATWSQLYSTAYKPTADDVDAVSASQGGTFQKQVQFTQGLRLQNAEYLGGIGYGSDGASFSGANLLLKSWYGIGFYSNYPNTGELGIMGYINVRIGRLEMKEQIIPGNYTNFDARYQARGDYMAAGQAYTKAESDARFVNWNHGAVGSVVFARLNPQSTTVAPGGTTAGSNIQPASVAGYPDTAGGNWAALRATGSLAGTWRCLGYAYNDMDGSNRHYSATLFVRIA